MFHAANIRVQCTKLILSSFFGEIEASPTSALKFAIISNVAADHHCRHLPTWFAAFPPLFEVHPEVYDLPLLIKALCLKHFQTLLKHFSVASGSEGMWSVEREGLGSSIRIVSGQARTSRPTLRLTGCRLMLIDYQYRYIYKFIALWFRLQVNIIGCTCAYFAYFRPIFTQACSLVCYLCPLWSFEVNHVLLQRTLTVWKRRTQLFYEVQVKRELYLVREILFIYT